MLDYEQDQAPNEKLIIQACLRSGRPYPKAIASAPVLADEYVFYYIAFDQLSSCRNYEYGPIPYTAIREYCLTYCTNSEQTERLIEVISQVDIWLRNKIITKMKKESKKSG